MEYQKVKSASKLIMTKGDGLSKKALGTMREIADIVGVTLGPSGRAVIVERFEHGLPPMVTKDGVTVMRSLGFRDPVAHAILECARDAAVKTANEAGDGTTTATVLSEAICRYAHDYCKRHANVPPQKVVRELRKVFSSVIEPAVRSMSITAKYDKKLLRSVAKVSANGEEALADAVMECFRQVGDDGNVTIIEQSGPHGYRIETVNGYPIPMGYEESCGKFSNKFINDAGTQRAVFENPVFILYHGDIKDIQTPLLALQRIGDEFEKKQAGEPSEYDHTNVVVVATSFSPDVVAKFAHASSQANSIKIFPLVIPLFPFANGQRQFLEDISAVTGATIFDPLSKPLHTATLADFGPGVGSFECSRFRSVILGHAKGPYFGPEVDEDDPTLAKYATYEDRLEDRVSELETMLETPESEMDAAFLKERYGKLTGGIAKLFVVGSSNGELKERRDRAEDAVCAVRGAIKHGCLPGGTWAMLKLISLLDDSNPVVAEVLKPALMVPTVRLFENCGFTDIEAKAVLEPIMKGIVEGRQIVYDAFEHRHGDPVDLGILDSTPAVLEAIRNSISIASEIGTLGGVVVFGRDIELERTEARDNQEWLRNANMNPANEQG